MSDKEFKLKIHFDEDGNPASSSIEALDKLKKGAQDTGSAHEEASKKMRIFGEETGEARRAVRELASEFPEASLALKAFVTPIGAAISGAIIIFESMSKKIEETNKKLDEAAEIAAKPDFKESIDARRKALEGAAQQAADFAYHLDHLKSAEQQILQVESEIDRARKERESANRETAHTQFSAEESHIKLLEAQGQITPGQAEQGIQRIRETQIRSDSADKISNAESEFARTRASLISATERTPGLAERAGELRGKADVEEADRKSREAVIATLEGGRETLDRGAAAAADRRDQILKQFAKLGGGEALNRQIHPGLSSELDQLENIIGNADASRRGVAHLKDLNAVPSTARAQADSAEKQLDENNASVQQLTQKIQQLDHTLQTLRSTEPELVRNRVSQSHDEAFAQLLGSQEGKELTGALTLARNYQSAGLGGTSYDPTGKLHAVAQHANLQAATIDQLIALLTDVTGGFEKLSDEVSRMQTRMTYKLNTIGQ